MPFEQLDDHPDGVVRVGGAFQGQAEQVHPEQRWFAERLVGEHRFVADDDAVLVGSHLGSPHPPWLRQQHGMSVFDLRDRNPGALDVDRYRRAIGRWIPPGNLRLVRIAVAVLGEQDPIRRDRDERVTHAADATSPVVPRAQVSGDHAGSRSPGRGEQASVTLGVTLGGCVITGRMTMDFHDACAAVCAAGTRFEIQEVDVLGVPTKVFTGTPPNIRYLFAAAAARTDDFIVFEDERWPMPRVIELIGRIGHALVHDLGVTKGDRIAIAMRNYPEWIAAFAAITSVGAVAVPMNAWWQTDEMVFALGDSDSKIVIADADRLNRMRAAEPGSISATVLTVREGAEPLPDDPFRVVALEDLLTDGATLPEVEIDPDDDVTILYTSGTTGHPKGAVSTHRAVLSSLMAFAARGAVERPARAGRGRARSRQAPACNDARACRCSTSPARPGDARRRFVGGSKLVMTYKWDPERALELIERETRHELRRRPDDELGSARSPIDFAERDTSSLLAVGGGGAPMPPELVKRIEDNFSKGRPSLGYGMTETNAYGPGNTGDDFIAHPTSTGRAVPIDGPPRHRPARHRAAHRGDRRDLVPRARC